MRAMNCKQLGGACDKIFRAQTFEEIAEQSKKHGMEMYQKGDKPHIDAMSKMQELMKSPEANVFIISVNRRNRHTDQRRRLV